MPVLYCTVIDRSLYETVFRTFQELFYLYVIIGEKTTGIGIVILKKLLRYF
jgi:hypothetical protein